MESSKSSESIHIDFKNWKQEIEDYMLRTIGIKPDDLPDYMYWDAFSRDETVENTLNNYFKKFDNNSIYCYWFNYINCLYFESTGKQLKDDNYKYRILFKKKNSCYNIAHTLINSLNMRKINV